MIKTSWGFNTASSEEDFKIKIKLEKANKTIKHLKVEETNLRIKIISLEKSETSLKQSLSKMEESLNSLDRYNKILVAKLREQDDLKLINANAIPSFLKVIFSIFNFCIGYWFW